MEFIKFYFDNKIQQINFSQISPNTTVLDFLRSYPNRYGTKEGCAEGDCGSCTVVIGEVINGKIKYYAVNSCMMFLPSLHGKLLITVEDLYNQQLHPIQQTFIEKFASQCGFCTPGFEMSLYALYKENPNPSEQEILEAIEGNLCRCTGYHSIKDAAKTFFKIKNNDHISSLEPQIINALKSIENKELIQLKHKEQIYFIPFTLKKAFELIDTYPEATIINGSTDIAIRRNKLKEIIKIIIDLSFIPDIKQIKIENNQILIGAGITVQHLKNFVREYIPSFYQYLKVFAAKQIRNRATIGGNIMTASPIGDLIPALITMNAQITVKDKKNEQTFLLEDFITGYRKTRIQKGQILTQITIPLKNDWLYKFYKVSKRNSLDISTVSLSAGIKIQDNYIKNIRLTYGGMDAIARRAHSIEKFLLNKPFDEQIFKQASNLISKEFKPISDARSSAKARTILAKNLILKFYNDLTQNSKK